MPKTLRKPFKNIQGQHSIETIILLTLVVATLIIIGPYVIRSINAFFAKQEQDVHDSFTEPLSPSSVGGAVVPDCQCKWHAPCDNQPCCGMVGCSLTENSRAFVCDPIGCQPQEPSQCEPDSRCCVTTQGACGGGACAGTEIEYITICGDGTNPPAGKTEKECVADPSCARCVNPVPGAQKCVTLGDADDEKGFSADRVYTAVSACSTAGKCEMRCSSGNIPSANRLACVPPPRCGDGFISPEIGEVCDYTGTYTDITNTTISIVTPYGSKAPGRHFPEADQEPPISGTRCLGVSHGHVACPVAVCGDNCKSMGYSFGTHSWHTDACLSVDLPEFSTYSRAPAGYGYDGPNCGDHFMEITCKKGRVVDLIWCSCEAYGHQNPPGVCPQGSKSNNLEVSGGAEGTSTVTVRCPPGRTSNNGIQFLCREPGTVN